MLSLIGDDRSPDTVWFDARIHRVTEALLFLVRLYRRLDGADTDEIAVQIRHGGLAGRTLGAADRSRYVSRDSRTSEDHAEASFIASVSELESNLSDYVKQIVAPLFVIFDFVEIGDGVLTEIVDGFVAGSVS